MVKNIDSLFIPMFFSFQKMAPRTDPPFFGAQGASGHRMAPAGPCRTEVGI